MSIRAGGQTSSVAIFALLATMQVAAQTRTPTLVYELTGGQDSDNFGASIDTAGDQDGDGIVDLLIGAPLESSSQSFSGLAVVVSGRSGLVVRQIHGDNDSDKLGAAVAGMGDIDHDGIRDLLIGVPGADTLDTNAGKAVVFSGATGALLREHAGLFKSEQFGSGTWNIGDLDADGVDDYGISNRITIGSFGDTYESETLRFSGASGAAFNTAPLDGVTHMVGAGDTNGDGHDDYLVAGAIGSLFGGPVVARLLTGSSGFLYASPAQLGTCGVGPARDFDGDGLNDFIIALSSQSGSFQNVQIRSEPHGLLSTLSFTGPLGTVFAPTAFNGTADVNGDGTCDLIVGFPEEPAAAGVRAGVVRIYSGTSGIVLATLNGLHKDELFGTAVRVLGDINGDGFPEFAIAAPGSGSSTTHQPGRVRVFTMGPVPWSHTPAPLAGAAGIPVLTGAGPLVAGTGLTVSLSNALLNAPALLVLGLAYAALPFKGGVLGPSRDFVSSPMTVTSDPMPLFAGVVPEGIAPGTNFWLQVWIQDAGGPAGFSATGTLVATTPP